MDRTSYTDTSRLVRLLREAGLDAVIGTAPENVTYASGYCNWDQRMLLSEELAACLWPANGEPVLVIQQQYRVLETFVKDVRTYLRYGAQPHAPERTLADAITDRGLASARIGIDLVLLPAARYLTLRDLLPKVTFVDASELFAKMRGVKTEDEIALLRRACAVTDTALAIGLGLAKAGETEKQVADRIDAQLLVNGADGISHNIFGSGPRSILGHHRGEPTPLEAGSLVRTDYGGTFEGYVSDLARPAVVGKPSERQRSTYDRCLELHHRCIERLRPGMTGGEFDRISRGLYAGAGMADTRPMFGHSIGLYIHERPLLIPEETMTIENSMVLCIENGLRDFDHGENYHLEDTVVVREAGAEILSAGFDTSRLFEIA